MERLLSKQFHCETRLGRLPNELQVATIKHQDNFSCESTNLFKVLLYMTHTDETYKQRIQNPNVTFLLVITLSSVKYFCSERILVKMLLLKRI